MNYLIIELLCFSFKTWSKQMWSFKLKEVLFDCLDSLRVDKMEGNTHSFFSNVSRGLHLFAKKFLLPAQNAILYFLNSLLDTFSWLV